MVNFDFGDAYIEVNGKKIGKVRNIDLKRLSVYRFGETSWIEIPKPIGELEVTLEFNLIQLEPEYYYFYSKDKNTGKEMLFIEKNKNFDNI